MVAKDTRVFISYRRDDTGAYAGWLFDRLAQQFGTPNIFKDVDSLHPGTDFPRTITQAVTVCDVLVALIGPMWAGQPTSSSSAPRIHDANDWVRLEIESALDQGIRVIPMLVAGATVPSEEVLPPSLHRLRHKQALRVHHDSFGEDVRRLISIINSPGSSEFDTDEARRLTRNRTARFVELERLYRAKIDLDQVPYKYDPFVKTTYRRLELDLLVDALDFDEEAVHIALALFDSDRSLKDAVKDMDLRRGVLATTPRRLIFASRRGGGAVRHLPYAQILNVDVGVVSASLTLTLADRNLVIGGFKPWPRLREVAAYVRDRIPRQR